MASLLAAAFAGHVIYLNTAPPPDNGPHFAAEIEVRRGE
jgi:hypothetical protein